MASRLDVAVKVLVDGERNLQNLNRDMQKVSTTADTTKGKLKSAFSPTNLAVTGVAVASAAVVGFLANAVDAASDLQESIGKTDVVFGDNADEVKDWAQGTAKSIGISKQAALEAAGTYGNLFRAFGIGKDKATDMSTTLVDLAADLASFNNTSTEDAINALRSGLSGETEPLKRYGVALSDVRLKAKALELGIYDGVGALDTATKSQAAYELILQDTALAQGDFSRTSEGLANQQRILQAQIEDVSAEVGTQLLPIIAALVTFLNDQGVPALRGFFDILGTIGKGIGRVAEGYTLLRNGVLTVLEILPGEVEEISKQMIAPLDKLPPAFDARASEAVRFAAQAIAAGGPVVAIEAGKIAGMLPSEIKARVGEIRAAGRENVVQFAAGLLDAQNDPQTAIDAMVEAQKTTLTRSAEVTRLLGQLNSKSLAAGLNDERDAVSLAAQAARAEIIARLDSLGVDGYSAGSALMQNLSSGINDAKYSAIQAARDAGYEIRSVFPFSEPKDPQSPFRGITKWGGNIIETVAEGIRRSSGSLASAVGGVGTLEVGADIRSAGQSAGGALSMGGNVTNLTVVLQNHGDPIKDEGDIIETLQMLTPFITGQRAALSR